MIINIKPVEVEGVVCTTAVVNVAMSESVAIRLVPCATVDGEAKQYPEASLAILGTPEDADIAAFFAGVVDQVQILAESRNL